MKQLLIIAFALSTFSAIAQEDSSAKGTLTLGTSYSPNANYYGQKAAKALPYVALAANYKRPSGFYLTGQAFRLLNDSANTVSAASLGLGFAFKLSSDLSLDLSYSHSFYPQHSVFLQASNPDNASASLALEKWLTTTLNVDYAFGQTQDVFATFGFSKAVNIVTSTKAILAVTPNVNVVGGTQHFYQTYITEKRLQDSLLGNVLPPIFGGGNGGTTTSTKTTTSTQFNLLSYNARIPLSYSRARYLIEAAYQLSVLSNKAQSAAGQANSFGTLSFYYQF
jgi:hypothetical protein